MDKLAENIDPKTGFIVELNLLEQLEAAYIGDKKPEENEPKKKEENNS